jgi:hypothetical protein
MTFAVLFLVLPSLFAEANLTPSPYPEKEGGRVLPFLLRVGAGVRSVF